MCIVVKSKQVCLLSEITCGSLRSHQWNDFLLLSTPLLQPLMAGLWRRLQVNWRGDVTARITHHCPHFICCQRWSSNKHTQKCFFIVQIDKPTFKDVDYSIKLGTSYLYQWRLHNLDDLMVFSICLWQILLHISVFKKSVVVFPCFVSSPIRSTGMKMFVVIQSNHSLRTA